MENKELIEKMKYNHNREIFYLDTMEFAIETFLDQFRETRHCDKELKALAGRIGRNCEELRYNLDSYKRKLNSQYKGAIEDYKEKLESLLK